MMVAVAPAISLPIMPRAPRQAASAVAMATALGPSWPRAKDSWPKVISTGTVQFNNGQRSATNGAFLRLAEDDAKRIWVSLDNGSHFNEVNVVFMDGATDAYDMGMDGLKLRGSADIALAVRPDYASETHEELCIAALPPFYEGTHRRAHGLCGPGGPIHGAQPRNREHGRCARMAGRPCLRHRDRDHRRGHHRCASGRGRNGWKALSQVRPEFNGCGISNGAGRMLHCMDAQWHADHNDGQQIGWPARDAPRPVWSHGMAVCTRWRTPSMPTYRVCHRASMWCAWKAVAIVL
jgi:hypothetical protein